MSGANYLKRHYRWGIDFNDGESDAVDYLGAAAVMFAMIGNGGGCS